MISSLADLKVEIPIEIREHLEKQFELQGLTDNGNGINHFNSIMQSMKLPPQVTTCRVNELLANVDEVLSELNTFLFELTQNDSLAKYQGNHNSAIICRNVIFQAQRHSILHDVIEIRLTPEFSNITSLAQCNVPPNNVYRIKEVDFSRLPSRLNSIFPHDFKVVICDRLCGEAVLRGSNIFVRGVLAADRIAPGDWVCVYAHVDKSTIRRGLTIDNYRGHCIFLGIGEVTCSRAEMFNQQKGIAVKMINGIFESTTNDQRFTSRAGPLCPPLNGILPNKMMLQNLPSIVVGHVLQAQENETIIDLCCAPGGKTSHVASLVKNNALIIACDKSRKKMNSAKDFFQRMGASCIIPLSLDSTKCVLNTEKWMSVNDIVSSAKPSELDSLLDVKGFCPNSFDRIILDPPCSALGLRPKLCVEIKKLGDLNKFAQYQCRLVSSAVSLLKSGGTLVYSTCTINSCENEKMVKYILTTFLCMKLVPIEIDLGLPGLSNCGLNDEERHMVRRFDPSHNQDTMGFFIAKFHKVM